MSLDPANHGSPAPGTRRLPPGTRVLPVMRLERLAFLEVEERAPDGLLHLRARRPGFRLRRGRVWRCGPGPGPGAIIRGRGRGRRI